MSHEETGIINLRERIREDIVRGLPSWQEIWREGVRTAIEPLFSNQRPGRFDGRRFNRRLRQLGGKTATDPKRKKR